jgi:putative transposase
MAQRPSSQKATTAVTAEQVRSMTVELLSRELPLGWAGYQYTDADVYNVLTLAAAEQRSIDSVCQQLLAAPSANLVRQILAARLWSRHDLEVLEARCNALLVAYLPAEVQRRPQRLAIDLTLLPYYGAPAAEPEELRRGPAQAGTTHFHCYATAAVLRAGRRVTVAVSFVYAAEDLLDVLTDLLQRVHRLGIRIKRLFLDRQFATVAILRWLQPQPFTAIVALPKRGARLQALLTGRQSSCTTYTMRSAAAGAVTFPLWVACRYAAGRRGKQGIEYLPFAVLGRTPGTLSVLRVADEYRQRFGIESGYRQMDQVRPRTTARAPGLRLLLVSIALLLPNLWVWLKAQVVAHTPRRARAAVRRWLDATFRLDRVRDLLIEAITSRYHRYAALVTPVPLTTPLEL